MRLNFDINLAKNYKSKSQIARILSEDWTKENAFCPNCLNKLSKYKNNENAKDFFCQNCGEVYELKSKHNKFGAKIIDGEYNCMLNSINSNQNPNLLLLEYYEFKVRNFLVIPRFFFLPNFIEKRKPLSGSAKRAGWIGCNILYKNFTDNLKINIIKNSNPQNPEKIRSNFAKLKEISQTDIEKRIWSVEILKLIQMQKSSFSLNEIYQYEANLAQIFPKNKNIKAKIRQQLQFLRDKNIIKFTKAGNYERI